MKSRYWITLSLRMIALVVIGFTIRPVAADVGRLVRRLYRAPNRVSERLHPENWTGDALLLVLGLYLLLGGTQVVNRLVRDFEARRCNSLCRSWVSVALRFIGLVLILITAKPIATELGRVANHILQGYMQGLEQYLNPIGSMELLFGLGLGLYLFLGGNWLVNRIFRGIEQGRCPKCGYDTSTLAPDSPCPECGPSLEDDT